MVTPRQRHNPVVECAWARRAHFLVHPCGGPAGGAWPVAQPDHDQARRALAVQHEVGEAMVTLLLSDFLQPWRNITVQVANLGGTFPAVVERMDHMLALRDPDRAKPSSRAHAVWVDCASLGPRALEQATAVLGANRVMLGTDDPIFDAARTIAGIQQSNRSAAGQARVLSGNAAALLERLA